MSFINQLLERLKKDKFNLLLKTTGQDLQEPSRNINYYDHTTAEEILPPHQSRLLERTRLTYCLLGKIF